MSTDNGLCISIHSTIFRDLREKVGPGFSMYETDIMANKARAVRKIKYDARGKYFKTSVQVNSNTQRTKVVLFEITKSSN